MGIGPHPQGVCRHVLPGSLPRPASLFGFLPRDSSILARRHAAFPTGKSLSEPYDYRSVFKEERDRNREIERERERGQSDGPDS